MIASCELRIAGLWCTCEFRSHGQTTPRGLSGPPNNGVQISVTIIDASTSCVWLQYSALRNFFPDLPPEQDLPTQPEAMAYFENHSAMLAFLERVRVRAAIDLLGFSDPSVVKGKPILGVLNFPAVVTGVPAAVTGAAPARAVDPHRQLHARVLQYSKEENALPRFHRALPGNATMNLAACCAVPGTILPASLQKSNSHRFEVEIFHPQGMMRMGAEWEEFFGKIGRIHCIF